MRFQRFKFTCHCRFCFPRIAGLSPRLSQSRLAGFHFPGVLRPNLLQLSRMARTSFGQSALGRIETLLQIRFGAGVAAFKFFNLGGVLCF